MSKLHELYLRQTLYGVEYRNNQRIQVFECQVTEIKKTVFKTWGRDGMVQNTTFRLSDLHHKEWNNYRLFITAKERDEFVMMCERQKRMASSLLDYGKYTTKQLDRIDDILIENIIK